MDDAHGGRLLLRRIEETSDQLDYEGEIASTDGVWPSRFRISTSDGRVEPSFAGETPPDWLVEFAIAALRAVWRASRAGKPWPRRLHRWRPGPETESESEP